MPFAATYYPESVQKGHTSAYPSSQTPPPPVTSRAHLWASQRWRLSQGCLCATPWDDAPTCLLSRHFLSLDHIRWQGPCQGRPGSCCGEGRGLPFLGSCCEKWWGQWSEITGSNGWRTQHRRPSPPRIPEGSLLSFLYSRLVPARGLAAHTAHSKDEKLHLSPAWRNDTYESEPKYILWTHVYIHRHNSPFHFVQLPKCLEVIPSGNHHTVWML